MDDTVIVNKFYLFSDIRGDRCHCFWREHSLQASRGQVPATLLRAPQVLRYAPRPDKASRAPPLPHLHSALERTARGLCRQRERVLYLQANPDSLGVLRAQWEAEVPGDRRGVADDEVLEPGSCPVQQAAVRRGREVLWTSTEVPLPAPRNEVRLRSYYD